MSDLDPFESTIGPQAFGEASGLAKTIADVQAESRAAQEAGQSESPAGWERYELQGEIGAGGMGRVFGAVDRQFGRKIALKQLLHPERGDARSRFELESFVTGNLEHPGIPAVYERGEDAMSRPFYTMRHVQGRTLGQAIDECEDLDARLRLIPVLIRVAQALAYAHSQGVVHRDIKPDNIVIGEHGEAFVLDWGIAKIRGMASTQGTSGSLDATSSSASTSTLDGQVIGTPAYMAPEQASGLVDRIDERTDVFALGAILYHLLSGRPPYKGKTVNELLQAAKSGAITDIEEAAGDAPLRLRTISRQALAKNSDERFASAGAFAAALENFTSDAIRHQDKGAIGHLANLASVLSIILAVVAVVATMATTASVSSQGIPAYLNFGLAGFGVTFAVIEYRSVGRYRLSPLILGLGIATILNGIGATFSGVSNMLDVAYQDEIFDVPDHYRAVLTVATRESISNLASSSALAMAVFLGWAIAKRRVLLSAAQE